jgi:hypothetical protein
MKKPTQKPAPSILRSYKTDIKKREEKDKPPKIKFTEISKLKSGAAKDQK